MNTSFSGSLPFLSTLFVFYYTDFMANKICILFAIKYVMYTSGELVKERSCKSALDRSRQLRERSRSFSNPFAPIKRLP